MQRMSRTDYYIGVDVGTSSVRAALVSSTGNIVNSAVHSIKIFEPQQDFYEQSSDNIWEACCDTVKQVCASIKQEDVKGIGFDGTCSLVALGDEGKPVTISPTGLPVWNVMMWMDHRAKAQAESINKTNHSVLKYVGGSVSLEMQTPKLLWLKQNLKEICWDRAQHFLELPDFMTWRATGSLSRSLCCLVCKWTYVVDADGTEGWQDSFFHEIGLGDLVKEKYRRIGTDVRPQGSPCGAGLTEAVAEELGLLPGTPVGTSIIDAHAGGLGCMACTPRCPEKQLDYTLTHKLAIISGTSTCHMAVSRLPQFVPGVWGPYYSAMVPGLWLSEGGQSATGKLIDHVIESHPSYDWIKSDAEAKNTHVHSLINNVLEHCKKNEGLSDCCYLTKNLHVWPDFHGNRTPLADPTLKGMICGLTLAKGCEELAKLYLATVQALAYGTRHIIETMNESGHNIEVLFACGGLSKNPVFVQANADVTGLPVVIPDTTESVLLGAAILGACAAKHYTSMEDAMLHMGGSGVVVFPQKSTKQYHEKKYSVYKQMLKHQREYQEIMNA